MTLLQYPLRKFNGKFATSFFCFLLLLFEDSLCPFFPFFSGNVESSQWPKQRGGGEIKGVVRGRETKRKIKGVERERLKIDLALSYGLSKFWGMDVINF